MASAFRLPGYRHQFLDRSLGFQRLQFAGNAISESAAFSGVEATADFLVSNDFEANYWPKVSCLYAVAMHQQAHNNHPESRWARAKQIRTSHGFTAPQLARYAEDGLIRTSHIRRPGQTRGVRFYHLGDIDQLIATSIELPASATGSGSTAQP